MCSSSKNKYSSIKKITIIFFEKKNSIIIGTFKGYVSAKSIKLNLFQIVKTKDWIPSAIKGVLMEEANKTQMPKAKKNRVLKINLKYIIKVAMIFILAF